MVPSPERYAVHKLIVASRRQNDANGVAKREKDVHQASLVSRHWKPPVARMISRWGSQKRGAGVNIGVKRSKKDLV